MITPGKVQLAPGEQAAWVPVGAVVHYAGSGGLLLSYQPSALMPYSPVPVPEDRVYEAAGRRVVRVVLANGQDEPAIGAVVTGHWAPDWLDFEGGE